MNVTSKLLSKEELITPKHLHCHKVLLIESHSKRSCERIESFFSNITLSLLATLYQVESCSEKIKQYKPDILLLSLDCLTQNMTTELAAINQTAPLPVVVYAKQHTQVDFNTIINAGIDSYIVGDISEDNLRSNIELAIARFNNLYQINHRLYEARKKLNERKFIERAKGILMHQKNFSEQEAYSYMRNSAMQKGQTIISLSKNIIAVFEMFEESL